MGQSRKSSLKSGKRGVIAFSAKEAWDAWSKLSRSDKLALTELFRKIIIMYAETGRIIPFDVGLMKNYVELLENGLRLCQSELDRCRAVLESMKSR